LDDGIDDSGLEPRSTAKVLAGAHPATSLDLVVFVLDSASGGDVLLPALFLLSLAATMLKLRSSGSD